VREIHKKTSYQRLCPLCSATTGISIIEHLKTEHRRTEAEAHALMEREMEGTLGWDPETKKRKLI
jgi:hypothetical protein